MTNILRKMVPVLCVVCLLLLTGGIAAAEAPAFPDPFTLRGDRASEDWERYDFTMAQVTSMASTVVIGTCLSAQTVKVDMDGSQISQFVTTVRVDRPLKGDLGTGKKIVVTEMGGKIDYPAENGKEACTVEGSSFGLPLFDQNMQAILCLNEREDGSYWLGTLGKFFIKDNMVYAGTMLPRYFEEHDGVAWQSLNEPLTIAEFADAQPVPLQTVLSWIV